MMNLSLVVVFKLLLDREPVGVIKPGDHDKQVSFDPVKSCTLPLGDVVRKAPVVSSNQRIHSPRLGGKRSQLGGLGSSNSYFRTSLIRYE